MYVLHHSGALPAELFKLRVFGKQNCKDVQKILNQMLTK